MLLVVEKKLNVAVRQFYQVQYASTVTIGEQVQDTSEGGPADDKPEPVIAGVDDILAALNQLIIEPISKRSMYDKYGE